MTAGYVELQVTSHFSFLRGASSPQELFAAAALLGYDALGVTDLGSVAGLVRAWEAGKETKVRLVAGTRLMLDDGRGLLLYPTDVAAWSRLSRLLTIGKSRFGKGGCTLGWSDVVAWSEGLIAVLLPDLPCETVARDLADLCAVFGDRAHMALSFRRRPDDLARLHALADQARVAGVRAVATGDVLYDSPDARLLQDVVTCIREGCTIDVRIGLADLQDDDPDVYEMIQRGDTLGVFQIESRAQMAMLPRMKPKAFYDLVIEVAIVRPGPIQGDMVHPYLRRREGKERPEYPRPELRAVLEKTLGVPLFQEQAMKVAIVGAGFTPAEADALRRAMATFKFTGGVSHFYDKLVEGMVSRGYPRDFAERTFKQIEGFGSYGFPESHAASFAKLSYASCWAKHHHPDVFCAALLNAQPMGFYAVAQVTTDAKVHGVEIRPACINASNWFSTLEPTGGRYMAVRLGLKVVRGLSEVHAAAIVAARGDAPFASVEEVWRRAGVPREAIEKLAEADVFHAFGDDRRQGLWKVRGLGEAPLPLFAAADRREAAFRPEGLEPSVAVRAMTAGREVIEDYRTTQLSLRAHPLTFLREELSRRGAVRCADLARLRDGRRVHVAGLITVRQKPGSAKGVLFITIQDESDVMANGILWPDRFEAQRRTVMSASLIGMVGRVQREGEVIHVICDHIVDHGDLLAEIGSMDYVHRTGRGDGARHAGSPDRGEPGWRPVARDCYWPPHADGMDPEDAVLRIKSHDFH